MQKYLSIIFFITLLIIPVVSFADGARIFAENNAENNRAAVLITTYNEKDYKYYKGYKYNYTELTISIGETPIVEMNRGTVETAKLSIKGLIIEILIKGLIEEVSALNHDYRYDYKKDYTKTADYWLERGIAYVESGMYEEAREALYYATMINPYDAEMHFYLGLTLLVIGDVEMAFEQYKILRTLNYELADKLLFYINQYNNISEGFG